MKPRRFINSIAALALVLSSFGITGFIAQPSPFVGIWRAIDPVDESLMRAAIWGPVMGRFFVTWTDSYFSFCDSPNGLAIGTGRLNLENPNLLEAHMRLRCFNTGESFEWDQQWEYRPAYHVLASQGDYEVETIWSRFPRPLVPRMDLRVNYGHDWVESFYGAGHTVWVAVTGSDGDLDNAKATIEVQTEAKDYWGGEEGFQTLDGAWDPATPDIQAGDWVFAQVDNGQTAKVHLGEITGEVEPGDDAIAGTIQASWFTEPVSVECLDWGSGAGPFNKDAGTVLTNGDDPYSCGWDPVLEWDLQPGQDVGVGYFGPDGHWVANAFFAQDARIVASQAGDWFWTAGFATGSVTLSIYKSNEADADLMWRGSRDTDEGGFVFLGYEDHGIDLLPSHYLVMSDGATKKSLVLETITVDVFDLEEDIMAGTAPNGREVLAVVGMADPETQASMAVVADSLRGAWMADFSTLPEPFDITEDMRPWSFAQIFDSDGDANEAPPPQGPTIFAWLEWDAVDGHNWPQGSTITLTVGNLVETKPLAHNETSVHFDIGSAHDLVVGDVVVMSSGNIQKMITIPHIEIEDFNLNAHTVAGVYDSNLDLRVQVEGQVSEELATDGDSWIATFEDLGPLMWGDAIQTDADGDEVSATIRTPGPQMYAVPDENHVYASEWTPGETLHLTIERPGAGNPVFAMNRVVPDTGSPYGGEVFFDLGFDLLAGDVIRLSDGRYDKDLAVSSLRVTGFDLAAKTISGTGDAQAKFLVRIGGEDEWAEVGSNGEWSVQHDSLLAGVWGEAIQPDGDGDETRDGFQAPET